jgi:hypothetical protein
VGSRTSKADSWSTYWYNDVAYVNGDVAYVNGGLAREGDAGNRGLESYARWTRTATVFAHVRGGG